MIISKLKLYVLFIFLLACGLANGQIKYDAQIDSLLNQTLQLKTNYEKLDKGLNEENNGLYLWIKAYDSFLNYHFGKMSLDKDQFFALNDQLLDELKALEESSPYYFSCIADVYLFISFTHILEGEYYTGWRSLVKAQRFIERTLQNFPDSYLNLRHKHVQLLVDYLIYNNLPVLFAAKVQALKHELVDVQSEILTDESQPTAIKRETLILTTFIYNRIFTDEFKSNLSINGVDANWSQKGPLEMLAYLDVLKKEESKTRKHLLQDANSKGYINLSNLLNLEMGKMYARELNDSSLFFLHQYISNSKNSRHLVYAYHQLCWQYFIKNNNDVIELLETIRTIEPKSEIDKQALNDFDNFINWNKQIIKSRLLFDGGYAKKAQKLLLAIDIGQLNSSQLIEYYYRLARVYHELDDEVNALLNYNKVVDLGRDNEFYFSAYSAFFAGNIYEHRKNCDMATVYYESCLKFNSPVYEESIHRRAKNGLERCEN